MENPLLTVLLVIALFIALIFPHELGHFIVAKLCKVQVNEFSFGMGPALLQKQGKETLYSLRLIPLGGYCAMEGEDAEEEDENPRSFNNKAWWQKILILSAGVVMNFLLAALLLSGINLVKGQATTTIARVVPDTPAESAGLLAGDRILQIGEERIGAWEDVASAIALMEKDAYPAEKETGKDGEKAIDGEKIVPLTATVERGGKELTFTLTPVLTEDASPVIGVEAERKHNFFSAIGSGFSGTVRLTGALLRAFAGLFTSGNVIEQISGPVGIVKVVGESVQYGLAYYLYLVALISLNLAIFNLLPFPALDGGRIVFVIIRALTGKAISDALEAKFHAFGLILLLLLFVVITVKDILTL